MKVHCTGKTPITTKKAADHAARMVARLEETPMHSYRCRDCHAWHIGSSLIPKKAQSFR